MTQLLDLGAAQQALVRAVEASPKGKRNPTSGRTCVYDDGKGNHCIVGQVLKDAGLELPAANAAFCEVSYGYLERGEITQLAADFLFDCQGVFDGPAEENINSTKVPQPRTWRQALAVCRERGYLDPAYRGQGD